MYFRAYDSIDNGKYCKSDAVPAGAEWVVTEKVHGTNTGIYVNGDGEIKVARRTSFADAIEKHYRADVIVDRHRESFIQAARDVLSRHGSGDPADFVIFYGELYGGIYPGLSCEPGLIPVQRGVYYSNMVHFSCFDILVVRPLQKIDNCDGKVVVDLWREARKALFQKNPTAIGEVERKLAEAAREELVPTLEFVRRVAGGEDLNIAREMPAVPTVVLAPHETLLSQDERVEVCTKNAVPCAEILFKGAREEALAFSKRTRTDPTTLAEKHGMPPPVSEREGNVVRTNIPCYAGQLGQLVIMKDKNPKFKEVAHGKHEVMTDDLITEAPRFVTRNRLDNVVSKMEIGTPGDILVKLLAEDALEEMRKRDLFQPGFTAQTEEQAKALYAVLTEVSDKVVRDYLAERH